MTVGELSGALMQGAYCRSGDTGCGQVWWHGFVVGVVGPRLMRLLREDPVCEELVLTVHGVPRQAYRMKARAELR